MSLDRENSIAPENIILPKARLFFSLPEKREVSYKDLYNGFLKDNGVLENTSSSEEESESENYSYPAFMQRIIERLDKYGQLALSDQIGMHKSDPRKKRKLEEEKETPKEDGDGEKNDDEKPEDDEESENSCEMYYDLSDNFIDDGDIQQNGGNEESEFQKAVNEGFYVVSLEDYIKSLPKTPKKPKKPKEKKETPKVDFQKKPDVNISHLSIEIQEKVEELRKLYEQKRKEGNPAPFPKGSAPILEKIVQIAGNSSADAEGLYNNISVMSGQAPEAIRSQFIKIKQKIEKNSAQGELNKLMRAFKRKLTVNDLKWSIQLRSELFVILESLGKLVNTINSASSIRGKKSKPGMNYIDEEAKFLSELKKASNGKLDNIDLKSEILDLPMPSFPLVSNKFEDPTIKAEDFEQISDMPIL